METLLHDLRYAVRTLARAPGFAAVAVLSLALGIGAVTTVFSLVNAVHLRPLPYADPARLVDLSEHNARELCAGCGVGTSYPTFLDWKAQARSFASLGAYAEDDFTLVGAEAPERLSGARVTAELFPTLGIAPARGRGFLPADDRPGAPGVALIGHELWQARFGGAADVLGRVVALNGAPHTIVGVMPPRFGFPERAQVWVPAAPALHAQARDDRGTGVVARLRPGVSLAAASREMEGLAARLAAAHPGTHAGWSAAVVPLHADVAGDTGPGFVILLGAVAFVLLIACANLAGLLLARGTGRRREIAVRAALGASRGRIVRQLLTESVLLAAAGGALGVLLSFWGVELAAGAIRTDVPFWIRFGIDGRVLAFAAAATALTGAAFGLAPALQASRPDLREGLRDGGHGASAGRRGGRLRAALVVAETALALVLLAGAGLMLRTFARVSDPDLGYDTRNLLQAELPLLEPRYDDPAQVALLAGRLHERLAALPGARAAALQSMHFLRGFGARENAVRVEGRAELPADAAPPWAHAVTPGYFAALGIPLRAGRDFATADRAGAPGVVIVNQAMAERLWPGESPLGRRVALGGPDSASWRTVVGVVGNVVGSPLGAGRPPVSYAYLPIAQRPGRGVTVLLRAPGDPMALLPALRAAVREVDPAQPLTGVRTVEQGLREWIWPVRMFAVFLGSFAAFAVLLAAIGIWGVVAYAVGQRTHEIGVRMALGARSADVLRLVLRQGVALAVAGTVIGVGGALAVTRVLRAMLFGTSATDPLTFAAVSALLLGVALLASWVPALRATRVDPMVALRAE